MKILKNNCYLLFVLSLALIVSLSVTAYSKSNTCFFTDSGAPGFYNNNKSFKAKCSQSKKIVNCQYRHSAKDWICTGPKGQKHDSDLEAAIAESCGCK